MSSVKKFVKRFLLSIFCRLGSMSPVIIAWNDLYDQSQAAYLLNTMRLIRFNFPVVEEVPKQKRIVILSPHPDDELIGVGGTIIKMLAADCDVDVIQFTMGDAPSVYRESQDAAKEIGFAAHYLDLIVDRMPVNSKSLDTLRNILLNLRPDIIFIPFLLDDNDDHRRVNEIFMTLSSDVSILSALNQTDIWSYQVYSCIPANVIVNITDVIESKIRGIECYASQFAARDWGHYTRGLNAFNIRQIPGYAGKEYAEVFYKAPLNSYLTLCRTYFGNRPELCYSNPLYRNKSL